jgi:hypothetical protein
MEYTLGWFDSMRGLLIKCVNQDVLKNCCDLSSVQKGTSVATNQ